MKRLSLLVVLVFALLASIPAVSIAGKGGSIGTQDTCAATLTIGTEDAGACGGMGTPVGPCTKVDYVGWIQLYWNGYEWNYKPCIAGNA